MTNTHDKTADEQSGTADGEGLQITEDGDNSRLMWITGGIAFLAWTLSVYDYLLFGNLLPLIQNHFGWSSAHTTALTMWVGLGTFLVALTVGPITDYFGRVKALMITVGGAALSSLFMGISAFIPAGIAFMYIALVRSLSGYGYSEQAVNTTYLSEIFPSEKRGYLYSFIQGGWPVGAILTSAFILWLQPVLDWHYLFVIATFPLVLLFVARTYLPESPRFEELEEVRTLREDGEEEKAQALAEKYEIKLAKTKDFTITQLFETDLRKHTIALSLSFILNWMGIQIMTVLITLVLTQGKNISFTNAIWWVLASNVLAFIGYVVHGWIGDRIGRRETLIGAWTVAGIILTGMLLAHDVIIVGALYAVGLFFFLGAYSALYTYMGESFPTRARGTGSSFVNAMGPLGAVLGSAVITLLQNQGYGISAAAIAAGSFPILLSGLLLYWARHVDPGQELEDIAQ